MNGFVADTVSIMAEKHCCGLGKRNTWLLWSAINAMTNPLLLLVGKGDAMMCVIIFAVNGGTSPGAAAVGTAACGFAGTDRLWPPSASPTTAVPLCHAVPIGAKFLADDILSDVIDYAEFLTGERAEARFDTAQCGSL